MPKREREEEQRETLFLVVKNQFINFFLFLQIKYSFFIYLEVYS